MAPLSCSARLCNGRILCLVDMQCVECVDCRQGPLGHMQCVEFVGSRQGLLGHMQCVEFVGSRQGLLGLDNCDGMMCVYE